MCTKSYSTRISCFSLYFCIRLYRVLNFFLYEAVPPCDGGAVYTRFSGPELHVYQCYSIILLTDIITRFLSFLP